MLTVFSEQKSVSRFLLDPIESRLNKLPGLFMLYLISIVVLILVSEIASRFEWQFERVYPDGVSVQIEEVPSLVSAEILTRFFVDIPRTVTHFHPLGYLMVAIFALSVAERSGLLSAFARYLFSRIPDRTVSLVFIAAGGLSNIVADWAYVILIPFAGITFAALGRNPVVGIFATFAGVSANFSANVFAPTYLDSLLLGITERVVQSTNSSWQANLVGNWFFMLGIWITHTFIGWFVTETIVAKRLSKIPIADSSKSNRYLSNAEKKGLASAGQFAVVFMLLLVATLIWRADAFAQLSDFDLAQSVLGVTLFLSVGCGIFYGLALGTVKKSDDIVEFLTQGIRDFAPVIVVCAAASLFIALLGWSNVFLVLLVNLSNWVAESGFNAIELTLLLLLSSLTINLFIGSAAAKWALMAPAFIPAMMNMGISPEAATAIFRIGDSASNIVSPFMVYFPIVVGFCQRWMPDIKLGTVISNLLPYSVSFALVGLLQVAVWALFNIPVGPDSTFFV
ncbi:MAG: AbgT family transporter [Pseudomonadota bacterium]